MATGTPFHPRTSRLCESHAWRQWAGYLVASSYSDFVQPEYSAIRHAAALIDVSPLYKYEVQGRDAAALVNRVVTQDVGQMEVGQVAYTPWCDVDGAVRQEGTVFRLGEDRFQINAAEPALGWLHRCGVGFDVELADRSREWAALALQGPQSARVLADAGCSFVGELPFFRLANGVVAGVEVTVSRTGYTGDLGYELWLPADRALEVWDRLMAAGQRHQVAAVGLAAMDLARLEAGFLLINVDYVSSEAALLADDRCSPFELGLGWAVDLDKTTFIGRSALVAEKRRGPRRRVVGVEVDWPALEALHADVGLMPELPLVPCRDPVPLYTAEGLGRQVGRATTRVWSSLLKKYIAIATVEAECARLSSEVAVEYTVHYQRRRVAGRVAKRPFFTTPRLRAAPAL